MAPRITIALALVAGCSSSDVSPYGDAAADLAARDGAARDLAGRDLVGGGADLAMPKGDLAMPPDLASRPTVIQVSIDGTPLDFTCRGNAYPPSGWIFDTNQPSVQVSLYPCAKNSPWRSLEVLFPNNAQPGKLNCSMVTLDVAVILEDAQANAFDTAYGSCTMSLTEVPVAMTDHAAGATLDAVLEPEAGALPQHKVQVTFDVPHS
jgi:hypothetical protein